MNDIKFICKCLGGSHSYGLATSSSDEDFRGCFLTLNKGNIIGLDRYEHIDRKGETDEFYWEARHFLNLMRKTNSQAMELAWNDKWIEITPEFKLIQDNRTNLVDSGKFFKSLCGYMQGERKLMMGERTGQLGGARFETLQKYKYSYKNAVQLLRLAHCGRIFFTQGFFPVDISVYPELHAELMNIKLHPESRDKDEILAETYEKEEIMKKAFDNRSYDYKFDLELANSICVELYKPLL